MNKKNFNNSELGTFISSIGGHDISIKYTLPFEIIIDTTSNYNTLVLGKEGKGKGYYLTEEMYEKMLGEGDN